ncbi:MAG: hypothetical protein Q8Q25_01595 [bacterium]|nr:hypothetical protein [bacterium]
MNKLKFTCCFCNQGIVPNEIDPCDINIVACYDKPQKDKPSQSFYCHFDCLKERLHKNIQGYFLKSNFIINDDL